MSGAKNLRRDVAAIGVGHGVYALGQWAIAASIAKLAGVEALAVFGLALAVGNPVYFLANMALRTAVARDASGEFAFGDYWRARMTGAGLAFAAMGLAAGYYADAWAGQAVAAILLFAAVKTVDGAFDLAYGRKQRDGQAAGVARSLFLRAFFGPLACASALLAGGGALWAGLLGWAAAAAVLFILFEARGFRAGLKREPARKGAASVIRRTWPLGVAAALAGLETAAPRFAIEALPEPEALGYFTAVFLFFQASVFMANAVGSATTPHLGRAHAAGDKLRFVRLTIGLAGVGAILGLMGVLASWALGPWLLTVLYTADYAPYSDLLVVVMAAAGLRFIASFLQFALIAAGRFTAQMGVHAILAAAAVLLAGPMVEAYGIAGGGYVLLYLCIAHLALMAGLASWSLLLKA